MASEESKRNEHPLDDESLRAARRQMIKSTIAAFPVVLTVTAGTAQAQGSITSATASAALKAGALEGSSEQFDVQQFIEDAENIPAEDLFIPDSPDFGAPPVDPELPDNAKPKHGFDASKGFNPNSGF